MGEMSDAVALRDAFPDRTIVEVAIHRSGHRAVAVAVRSTDTAMDLWTPARVAAKEVGCYPVLCHREWQIADGLAAGGVTPSVIVEDVPDLDDVTRANYPLDESWIDLELNCTRLVFGAAPTVAEATAALPTGATQRDLDRWLFDWEKGTGCSPRVGDGYLDWGEDYFVTPDLALVLLPSPYPWDAIGFLAFFGASNEQTMPLLHQWWELWGAQLVAHFGTFLWFTVERPPENLDDAWQLAWEQESVAGSTTGPAGVSVRHHARALLGRDRWFLHDRP